MSIYKGLHSHPMDGKDNMATWKEVIIFIAVTALAVRGLLWLVGAA